MLVIGWKSGVNVNGAVRAIHKHVGLSLDESKKIVDGVIDGKTHKLPDDFILREDLEDCKFIIQ